MGESATLDPADHVSVTLLYSRAGRGLSSVISMPRLPEGSSSFTRHTQGDGVASWPPARVLVHAPAVPSPIRHTNNALKEQTVHMKELSCCLGLEHMLLHH